MKKFFTKLITFVVVTGLMLASLSGCKLITTNVDRDMNQVIATVSIDSSLSEDIYKRELIASYNSYGAMYQQYYGYDEAETYEVLLDNLINDRIICQYSKKALTSAVSNHNKQGGYFKEAEEVTTNITSKDKCLTKTNYKGESFTSLNIASSNDSFMTEYEYYLSQYNVLNSIEALFENLENQEEDSHDHAEYENISINARATLTKKEQTSGNEVEIEEDEEFNEITEDYKLSVNKIIEKYKLGIVVESYSNLYELNLKLYKTYIEKFNMGNTKARKSAIKKAIKLLSSQGLITEEESQKETPKTVKELLSLTCFKDSLNNQYESLIVEKYRLALTNEKEKLVQDEDSLYQEYVNLYNKQKQAFDNSYTEYENAIQNLNDESLVLYNIGQNGDLNGYGYVANLLIGFSTEQANALSNYTSKSNHTDADNIAYRNGLLDNLLVKDMRYTWVISNYGTYDEITNKFTFDEDYLKTDKLKEFDGVIEGAKKYTYHDNNDLEKTSYTYTYVKGNEMSFGDFWNNLSADMGFASFSSSLFGGTLNSISLSQDKLDIFKDYIYAYSTDPGSLSDNYGYLYSPKTNKYVEEFKEASKELINQGEGAYTIVATDYGYHILLCTKVLRNNSLITREDFIAQLNTEGTLPYVFKNDRQGKYVSTEVSNIVDSFLNIHKDSSVTKYEKTYKDLIAEKKDK